jgi:hypothetical protein
MNFGIIKTLLMSIGAACIVQLFLHHAQSDAVFVFLKTNITNIQITLLAINAATLGIVLTKIREIIDKTGQREAFDSTRSEMLLSIKEQMWLISVSLMIIAMESAKGFPYEVLSDVWQACLIASFIYSMMVLYDTAKSVFILLDY